MTKEITSPCYSLLSCDLREQSSIVRALDASKVDYGYLALFNFNDQEAHTFFVGVCVGLFES